MCGGVNREEAMLVGARNTWGNSVTLNFAVKKPALENEIIKKIIQDPQFLH